MHPDPPFQTAEVAVKFRGFPDHALRRLLAIRQLIFETAAETRRLGLRIMVGSMVSTSLSLAPAMVLAATADWVDLDSPLLLARDREHGLTISDDGLISQPTPALWG